MVSKTSVSLARAMSAASGGECNPQGFNKDAVPMPLTFDALSAAQAYVGRNQPGAVRIVRVTDESEREVVEPEGT